MRSSPVTASVAAERTTPADRHEILLSLLGDIAWHAGRGAELRTSLNRVLQRTRTALGYGIAAVVTLDPRNGRFVVLAASPGEGADGRPVQGRRFSTAGTLAERAMQAGPQVLEPAEPFVAADPILRAFAGERPLRNAAAASLPEIAHERGVLLLADAAAGGADAESRHSLVSTLATHIALAFERKREGRRRQGVRELIAGFAAVSKVAAGAFEESTMLAHTMEKLMRVLPALRAELLTVGAEGVRVRYIGPDRGERRSTGAGLGPDAVDPLHERVRQTGEPACRTPAIGGTDHQAGANPALPFAVCVPLVRRGTVCGSLFLARGDGAYGPNEIDMLSALGRHLASAMAPARVAAGGAAVRPVEAVRPVAAVRPVEAVREVGPQRARSRALRALGQLAAGVTHDLNNALHPIVAYAEMIRRAPEDPERVRTFAERILLAARDGADIVGRVQRFTRRTERTSREPVELRRVGAEALELTKPQWSQRPASGTVRIVQAVEPGLWVRANAAELRQALLNLIANALDAMPSGGTLRFVSGREDDRLLLAVQDTGTGMPPDVLARATEPFFTTKGALGTGLGLSEVFGIVERLGGNLEIASWPDIGTTVLLRLPAAGPRHASGGAGEAVADRRAPGRILLVDDNLLGLEAMAAALREAGHEVVLAATVDEALRRFGPDRFLAVITDLGMPDGSGWDVLDHVRGRDPAVRLGVVTGWAVDDDDPDLRRRGIDFVFRKPVDPDELVAAL